MKMKTCLIVAAIGFFMRGYHSEEAVSQQSSLFFVSQFRGHSINVSTLNYWTADRSNQLSCVVLCAGRQDCGHAVFCGNTESCYLDREGVNYCKNSVNQCSCSSRWRNVALNSHCEASTGYSPSFSCTKAVDGLEDQQWASFQQGVGAWIRIYLDRPTLLLRARVMQRRRPVERNKDIRFEFSDGSVQELPYRDKKGYFWDDLDLQHLKTSWVNISVESVYSVKNNGFSEIELYAQG